MNILAIDPATTRIHFTIPGEPLAQPRQRHRIASGGGGQWVQNYTPAKAPVNAYKAAIRLAFAEAYQGAPLAGPIDVRLLLVFPRRKTQLWKTKPMPRFWHTKKPDEDNCTKAIYDALNKLAWVDDSQVCRKSFEKWVASGDEQPRLEITIEVLK